MNKPDAKPTALTGLDRLRDIAEKAKEAAPIPKNRRNYTPEHLAVEKKCTKIGKVYQVGGEYKIFWGNGDIETIPAPD